MKPGQIIQGFVYLQLDDQGPQIVFPGLALASLTRAKQTIGVHCNSDALLQFQFVHPVEQSHNVDRSFRN